VPPQSGLSDGGDGGQRQGGGWPRVRGTWAWFWRFVTAGFAEMRRRRAGLV